ncbi:MAG: hypothetical protein EG826_01710 [Deltaproteobacteria bacterium]|nr:hypothetical protein [Deltaproteobacteria bacterium]
MSTYGKKPPKEEISEAPQVEELLKNFEFHKAIQRITGRIQSAVTLREIVLDIKEDICRLFKVHRLTIYLIDKTKNEIFTWQDEGGQVKELRFPIDGTTFAGCVADRKKMLRVADAYNEREIKKISDVLYFDASPDRKLGTTTGQIVARPILYDGSILGVMEIMNKKDGDAIDDYKQIFLEEIESCLSRTFFLHLEFEQHSQEQRARLDKLIRDKAISPGQLDKALKEAFEASKDLSVILTERYHIPKKDIGAALADHFSYPFAAYGDELSGTRQLFTGIARSVLVKMKWFPLTMTKGKVHVLIDDPWDQVKKRDIEKTLKTNSIQYYVALVPDILKLIDRSYPGGADSAPVSLSERREGKQTISERLGVTEISAGADTRPARGRATDEPQPVFVVPQNPAPVSPDNEPAASIGHPQTDPPEPEPDLPVPFSPKSRLKDPQALQEEAAPLDNLRQMSAAKSISEKPARAILQPSIHVPRTLAGILLEAANLQASDVHFEPDPASGNVAVRIRIDRQFWSLQPQTAGEYETLLRDVKVLARLDTGNRLITQRGEMRLKLPAGGDLSLRITIIPTHAGVEDTVIHLTAKAIKIPLEGLGLSARNYADLTNILRQPRGVVLFVGPAGDEMTATLHACLDNINTPEKKIWTVEESVEIRQTGLRQVSVDPQHGLDFPHVLRSFLDADPDVIMAGRLPDLETAKLCMDASLRGRLVLSSLWADSITDAIGKCLLWGISHPVFADAMLSIVEQRMIKSLCPKCKGKYHPSRADYEELAELYGKDAFGRLGNPYSDRLTLFHPQGCRECGNAGYSGRVCASEIFIFTPEIKRMIRMKESPESIYQTALARGMSTLLQDGISKVLGGQCDSRHVRLTCLK